MVLVFLNHAKLIHNLQALLKLAAPDMNSDEEGCLKDEPMPDFDVYHALTGAVNVTYTLKG